MARHQSQRSLRAWAPAGLLLAFVLALLAAAATGPARPALGMLAGAVTLLTILGSLVAIAFDIDRRAKPPQDPEAQARWAAFERAFWEHVEHQRRA